MGSGCLQTPISNDCGTFISSNCVKYQGLPYPQFDVCTNDTQTEINTVIFNYLDGISTGDGITPTVTYNCSFLTSQGSPASLTSILQVALDSICSIKSDLTALQEQVASSGNNYSFDMSCVTPLAGTQTLQTVIQAIIYELCDLSDSVGDILNNQGNTTIINQVVNQALANLISTPGGNGLRKTTEPSGLTTYSITGLPLPGCAIPYFGSLSLFDSSGKGLPSTAAQGWYLCNGNNNTPDLRGFTIIGAIQGVNGPALNPIVDPVSNNDSSMNYSVGQVGGLARVTLNNNNIPAHSHPVNDPTHDHPNYYHPFTRAVKGGGNDDVIFENTDKTYNRNNYTDPGVPFIGKSATGITVGNNATSNTPHENRMPFKACNFVIRFD